MVNSSAIPDELRDLSQWVLWKYEDVNGNRTKVLYNPQNFRASTTAQSTWVTFDRAYRRYYSAMTTTVSDGDVVRYDGVGFVLSESDDYVAWDFDHCIEDGQVSEPAASYIKQLNSYTEISPSGHGIRVLTKGKLPPHGRKKGPFETYESKRFVTITGNHLDGTPYTVESRPQEILQLHHDIFGDAPEQVTPQPFVGLPAIKEDEDLLEIAKNAKDGWKFTQVYFYGDLSEFPQNDKGKGDHSVADLWLCGKLAFFAGPDPERIDRLFRQSALFRAKWDMLRGSTTYGTQTIAKALEGRTEFFGTKAVEVGELSGTVNGIPFWTKDGVTMTTVMSGTGKNAEPVDQIFANFDLRINGLLKKADTGRIIWRGTLTCDGSTIEIELDSDMVNEAGGLAKVKNWPTDATVLIPRLWPLYKQWLSQTKTSRELLEEKLYYGFHDIRSGSPTLLLPGKSHAKYLWRNPGDNRDPAMRGMFTVTDKHDDIITYLNALRNNMPHMHEHRYVYTTLGWLCACIIAPFLREHQKGFPTLMISGLHGSGKSTLIEGLIPHIGVKHTESAFRTSAASIARVLSSNNIIPLVLDELRTKNEYKTDALEAIIRDNWDERAFSLVDKGVVISGLYTAPLALVGQNSIMDVAALERSVCIRLDRRFMDVLKTDPAREHQAIKRLTWLQHPGNDGLLGRVLINWVSENYDSIPDLITMAEELMEKYSTLKMRRFKSYVAVTTGLILLAQIFKQYGVKMNGWLADGVFMPAILESDPQLERAKDVDVSTMQELFTITDKAILNSQRAGRTLIGTTLVFDDTVPSAQKFECPRYVYFDAKRWYYTILQEYAKNGTINLQDEATFYSMLEDQVRQDDTAVVSFGTPYGSFRKNCVKVDMDKIIELYSINAEGWCVENLDGAF